MIENSTHTHPGVIAGGTVKKVDAERRLVMGWAMVAVDKGLAYIDNDKSHIPQDVIMNSALDFMLHSRKSDVMHNEHAEGTVVFAWPFLDGYSDEFAQPSDGTRGFAIGVRFSPAVFAKFESGEYTGFSTGGDAMAMFVSEDQCPACNKPKVMCPHGGGS